MMSCKEMQKTCSERMTTTGEKKKIHTHKLKSRFVSGGLSVSCQILSVVESLFFLREHPLKNVTLWGKTNKYIYE